MAGIATNFNLRTCTFILGGMGRSLFLHKTNYPGARLLAAPTAALTSEQARRGVELGILKL